MTRHLNVKYNKQFNHKRVYRLMKIASLQSEGSKNKMDATQNGSENLLNDE